MKTPLLHRTCHYSHILYIICALFLLSSCADLINKITKQDTKKTTNDSTLSIKKEVEVVENIDIAPPTPPAIAIPDKTATNPHIGIKADMQVTKFCENMPFVDYNNRIREAINKSWMVKQSGSYDKGFRDAAEFDKWDKTQHQLYNKTFEICKELALCSANNSDKIACEKQHNELTMWQDLHKTFLEKAGILESSQPPPLCNFVPNANDLRYCFEQIANRIDKKCNSKSCLETSQCWRSVSILDQIVLQSSSSCSFAKQELKDCQGYKSALKRKVDRVDECKNLTEKHNINLLPIL